MIWITSDLHLGHKFIAGLRNLDIEEHDLTIIKNIKRKVRPEDTLWILGDLSMGDWRNNVSKLLDIDCHKHVVLGNHDRPHAHNPNGHAYIGEFAKLGGFESVTSVAQINHNGQRILLSHFPYDDIDVKGDEGRFSDYRLRDGGRVVFHGHTHSNVKLTKSLLGTSQVHVGLDAWDMRPVSFSDAIMLAV